ncbi:MAG TPA: thiamine pyrophosphate-dependent enzyme [Beijerinckiaceae bacterium]|jgi:thiamine pyrophosphate-dependent acetolactate synthase large subunit-like protein|nr:aldehyde dehydrogenase [Microvirga sp.]HZB38589.1 thiamine pyrophosphate-dependent enzyme [Beijerinckiaceae bacterium]
MTVFDRRAAVARLLEGRQDLLVVSGLGSPTYDVAAAGDHPRNFYLWGAMGGAAMVGLGLALAQPRVPVLVVTGDGELLMGLGGLATIAAQNPSNLAVAVLDNERYGETGGQKSHTAYRTNLAAVARGCGLDDSRDIASADDLRSFAERIHRLGESSAVGVIKVSQHESPRVLPARDGGFLKDRLMKSLKLVSS